jgi:hypothetical protein
VEALKAHVIKLALALSATLLYAAYVFVAQQAGQVPLPPMGLPADYVEEAQPFYESHPAPFAVQGNAENAQKNIRLWDLNRKVATTLKPLGQDFSSGPQQTDDCVAWGMAYCIATRLSVQTLNGTSAQSGDVWQPFLYGTARVSIRRHMGLAPRPPCGQGGAYPSDAVQALAQFGFVLSTDAGVPGYSKRIADELGCGAKLAQFLPLGAGRSGDAYPIRNTSEARDAICNLYPCTLGCPWLPGSVSTVDGRRVTSWNFGSYNQRSSPGHQVAIAAYDGSVPGKVYFGIKNSHGPRYQPVGLQGEPDGVLWVTGDTLGWLLERGTCFAVNDAKGFPANKLDLSAFDELLNLSPATDAGRK